MRKHISSILQNILVPFNSLKIKKNLNEDQYTADLRIKVKNIKIPKKNKSLAHNQWLSNIIKLKKYVLTKNPKNFLQWDVVRNTMFIGNALFSLTEFNYLKKHGWEYWKKYIIEKKYIPVEPYLLYFKSSGNLIHQAYHIAQFEKNSGKKIKDFDYIFEYGGGYGCMCQLIHNLGFKGNYVIFDFPIISAIQLFYLKMNGLNATSDYLDKKAKIFCLDSLKNFKKILPNRGNQLFLAAWSLSESPISIRKQVFPIVKNMNCHLLAYQSQFNEINNIKYFKDYQKKLYKLKWWGKEIEHLKGHNYLFGFS